MNPAFHIIQEETGKGSFSVTTEMFSDLPRSGALSSQSNGGNVTRERK